MRCRILSQQSEQAEAQESRQQLRYKYCTRAASLCLRRRKGLFTRPRDVMYLMESAEMAQNNCGDGHARLATIYVSTPASRSPRPAPMLLREVCLIKTGDISRSYSGNLLIAAPLAAFVNKRVTVSSRQCSPLKAIETLHHSHGAPREVRTASWRCIGTRL